SNIGRHGLGLMLNGSGGLHAILRSHGKNADIINARQGKAGFEIVSLTWGARGVTMHRDRKAAGVGTGIDFVSSDPGIRARGIGGPGSGDSPLFQGDLAEIRVYSQQLDNEARERVEAELFHTWFERIDSKDQLPDPSAELYEELISPRGPFWPRTGDRS